MLTNTMDVLIDATIVATRKIEVNDVHYVLYVKTTSRNASSDKDRGLGSPKCAPMRD
jgi:hypothetical protein